MPFNPHALSMLVRCAMEVVDCFCFGIFVVFISYKPIKPYIKPIKHFTSHL